jgi:hypothetical protein
MDDSGPDTRPAARRDEETADRRADPPPGSGAGERSPSGEARPDGSDGRPAGEETPVAAHVGVATVIIATILAAFLHRIAAGDPVPPWLVGLVSLLGVAAAAAVLGGDAVRTAYAVVRGLQR